MCKYMQSRARRANKTDMNGIYLNMNVCHLDRKTIIINVRFQNLLSWSFLSLGISDGLVVFREHRFFTRFFWADAGVDQYI